MSSPASIGLRGTRATVFGTATLLLALGAHALGGGDLPGPFVLLAAGLPTACVAVVLARRVRGLAALTVVLALTQVVLHELLATTVAATSCTSAMPAGPHRMHADPAIACGAMPGMSHGAGAAPAMLATHAVAVLATAVLLAWGERLATRLWRWVAPATMPFAVLTPREAVGALVRAGAVRQAVHAFIDTAVQRRGPPVRGRASVSVLA